MCEEVPENGTDENGPDPTSGLIYHYTTALGMQAILTDQAIFATHFPFLNDTSEMNQQIAFAIALARAIEKISNRQADATHLTALENLYALINPDASRSYNERIMSAPVYTTSFCDARDLLSQWRGYSNYQPGYAIGYSVEDLRTCSTVDNYEANVSLRRVTYKAELGTQIAEKTVARLISDPSLTEDAVYVDVLTEMARIKEDVWKEEREWRLVSVSPGKKIETRVSGVQFVSYVKLKMPLTAVREIVAGPGIGIERRLIGVRAFAQRLSEAAGLTMPINVTRSVIPYE